MPSSAYAAFDAALKSLAQNGITFQPSPRTVTKTDDGAQVSGAVFSYRYQVPQSFPRPSDIGTDETFNMASVTAIAASRVRQPLTGLGSAPAGVDSAGAPTATIPSTSTVPTIDAAAAPLSPGSIANAIPSSPVAGSAPGDVQFALPARVADPLPGQFQDSYRFVLLAALAGVGGLFFLVRKRAA
jgi:hypothetical protein